MAPPSATRAACAAPGVRGPGVDELEHLGPWVRGILHGPAPRHGDRRRRTRRRPTVTRSSGRPQVETTSSRSSSLPRTTWVATDQISPIPRLPIPPGIGEGPSKRTVDSRNIRSAARDKRERRDPPKPTGAVPDRQALPRNGGRRHSKRRESHASRRREDRALQPGAAVRRAPVVRREHLDIVSLGEEGGRDLGEREARLAAGGRDRADDEDPHCRPLPSARRASPPSRRARSPRCSWRARSCGRVRRAPPRPSAPRRGSGGTARIRARRRR